MVAAHYLGYDRHCCRIASVNPSPFHSTCIADNWKLCYVATNKLAATRRVRYIIVQFYNGTIDFNTSVVYLDDDT